jgi:hypothetical protein
MDRRRQLVNSVATVERLFDKVALWPFRLSYSLSTCTAPL